MNWRRLAIVCTLVAALLAGIPQAVLATDGILGGGGTTNGGTGESNATGLLGGTIPAQDAETPNTNTGLMTEGPAAGNGTPSTTTPSIGTYQSFTLPAKDVTPIAPFDATPYIFVANYDMPYIVGVDTINQVITIVERGEDGRYNKPVNHFICSTGTASDPTPAGTYQLPASGRPEWSYFKKYKAYVRYPVQIFGNYFFHSLIYNSQNLKSQTASSRRNLGKPASHGCIRMWDHEAQWLSENVLGGSLVVVYEGINDPDLNAALRAIK